MEALQADLNAAQTAEQAAAAEASSWRAAAVDAQRAGGAAAAETQRLMEELSRPLDPDNASDEVFPPPFPPRLFYRVAET